MSTNQFETILLDVDEAGVATLTINRPDKLNALSASVLSEIDEAVLEVNKRDDIKALIVTGSGTKAFVAGADIGELQDLNVPRGTAASERGQTIFSALENIDKPVIAAIEGYTLGGGFELALACHLRVASTNAVFGLPEVSLGLIPGYGGTQRLTRLIGRSRSLEMILTGNKIKADLALTFGVVNRLVAPGEALTEARSLVATIMKNGPVAVASAIKAVKAVDQGVEEGLRVEAELFGELCGTEDFKEGTGAFMEKRKPEFKGY